jgi:hypothetical protein
MAKIDQRPRKVRTIWIALTDEAAVGQQPS